MSNETVKCNSGHEAPRSHWECPVCVKAQRDIFIKQNAIVEWAVGLLRAHEASGSDVLVDKEAFDILREVIDEG